MTKTTNVLVLAIASVLFTGMVSFPPVHADTQVDIDFESLTAGDSVEGLGAIHPDLEIQSPASYNTEVVEEGAAGFPGTAYNTSGGGNNGCLDGLQGMGSSNFDGKYDNLAEATERISLDFSFNGKTVNAFSIETYDYGDFSPFSGSSSPMILEMNAYDAANTLIDLDTFEITAKNSKYDACGTDGIQTLQVSESGISRIEIRATSGPDPGVGFDNLNFTLEPQITEVEIDIKPGSDPSSWNCKNTKGGMPIVVFSTPEFNAATIDLDTLSIGGLDVTEVHNQIHREDKNNDGLDDAVLHLDSKVVCEATSDNNEFPLKEMAFVTIAGSTTDDTGFEGLGDIRIVKR